MYKKWLLILLVTVMAISGVVTIFAEENSKAGDLVVESELMDNTLRYQSNQYTQPEPEIGLIEQDVSLEGFDQVVENDVADLYVNKESLALKIVDKRTGYVWSSGLDEKEQYNLNDTWTNLAQSAITIEYLDDKGKEKSESILTSGTSAQLTEMEDGFRATIPFADSGISIDLVIQLDGNALVIHVPNSSIQESESKLLSLRAYPFLGGVEKNTIPGYMFIPDGSGALMRFQEDTIGADAPYQAWVYGSDEGFAQTTENKKSRVNPAQKISMPVYGLVHGVNQNGLFTIIESGEKFGELIAYPSGVSSDFNWITTTYHYRYSYFQPTSQSMDGYNTYQEDRNPFDITERITLLANDDANYVGMAKNYQTYLLENGQLSKEKDEVDVRLEFLGAEVKDGLLWDSVYPMTKVREIPRFINRLKQKDVENMHVVYRGWTEDGMTGTLPNRFPIEEKLGKSSEFESTHNFLEEEDIDFYYYTDYTKAFDGAKGFSGRSDVARKINAQTIGDSEHGTSFYFLNPKKSLEIAKNDVGKYKKNNISNLAIDSTGYELFSDFSSELMRTEVEDAYKALMQSLQSDVGSIAMYRPNDYMWHLTDRYHDIPMFSSNYSFVSDTVPFIQIVLKGYLPYYATFSNFHSNTQDDLLRMIEYGAYPSFYLTKEPSHLLIDTPSKDLYTTQFEEWESAIVEQNLTMQQSLGQVEGASIIKRIVHDIGVIEVIYSNGKSMVVNYNHESVEVNGKLVDGKGFRVMGWGDQS
ncbi:DUF5696 domain-containing protein [Paraliobacillus sp. JSM ZJ581]|uniref:DUF5696 domain-containing protein n=1 Tax=Paraliobacillus sp. JSM ZJ581 TaxID=3342118 RepID=UPI0035A94A9B